MQAELDHQMRVIIAGGGTGGHLFPAVALAEELRRQCARAEVLFAGASNGIEARWLPASGLRYELFAVRGFTGKDPLTRLRAVGEFLRAVSHARTLLRSFGAELVVSAGGYAAAPMAMAAITRRTPLVLLEQNVRPGLANRLLWRFANQICVGFDETAQAFGRGPVEVTGNPVRFSRMPRIGRRPAEPIQILVLGGSSGAHRLNLGALTAFKILKKTVINFLLVHQTGEADVGLVEQGYRALGCDARVVPFIDDVAAVLDWADLVVARAGAMTVSELALAGRPAILVPYPFHPDHQQEHNARVLTRTGGAIAIPDDEHLGDNLAAQLQGVIGEPQRLAAMGCAVHRAARPDAARRIAEVCLQFGVARSAV